MNISEIDKPIIPYYSPISSKGGRRRKIRTRKYKTRKYKRSDKTKTRRKYN